MMKFGKYVLISAALLSGAACLTACSSDDTVSDVVNPNLSPDGKAVKTEFAINIPRAKNARMSADNTQNSNNFLGMYGIKLIPLTSDASSSSAINNVVSLGDIDALDNKVDAFGTKKFTDISIPVGTSHFQFFGHAPQGTGQATVDEATNNFGKGVLTDNLLTVGTLGDVEFKLVGVKLAEEQGQEESLQLLKQLKAVQDAQGEATSWKAYAENVANNDKELTQLYKNFIKLQAGSANSIMLALENLYNAIAPIASDNADLVETKIATAVRSAMTGDNGLFNVSGDDNVGYKLAWKDAKTYTYPTNINLPEGAVNLSISDVEDDTKGYFTYSDPTSITTSNNTINIEKISFPASLYYATNTALWATSSATEDFPTTATDWSSETWTNWEDVVKSTARKIALKDKIQYAVASMKLTVACVSANLPTNKQGSVNVPEKGYELTGVLIGGQPASVGFDFKNKTTEFANTIYDRTINSGVTAKFNDDSKNANYTLVLPNVTTNAATAVNFALEFKNTGKAFYGKDGLVPEGGTFYIVGKLDPEKATNKKSKTHIFESDTQTTVNANITTLANAYNCIPDLRATNLSLGLAVDLEWQVGLNFDVNIGE